MNKLLLLIFFLFTESPNNLWNSDFNDALLLAKEENKNVLLYFSGSDWCKPCIRMKTYVLETSEFIDFAEDHLVLLQVDFPRLKKNRLSAEQTVHNEKIAEKYNPYGIFPLLLMLDVNGAVVKRIEYRNQSSEEIIDQLKQ